MPEAIEDDIEVYGFDDAGTPESRAAAPVAAGMSSRGPNETPAESLNATCTTDAARMTLGLRKMATGLGKLLEVQNQQFMAYGPAEAAAAKARNTQRSDFVHTTDATGYGF